MKKIIIISSILLIVLIIFYLVSDNKEKSMIVVACPTFHYMLEKLEDKSWVEVLETNSTLESLVLYEEGMADIIISSRALTENEPKLVSEKIGKGYDFLYKEDFPMWEEEMDLISFYTNLPPEEIINDFKHITEENLIKMDGEIEEYIGKGVVITSLDGYLSSGMAQIYKSDFSIVRLTRLPRIHYPESINPDKLKIIKEAIKEN